MFGKKKKLLAVLNRESRQKPKIGLAKLSRRKIMINIEQMGQGEALS